MVASYLKPSQNSNNELSRSWNDKRFLVKKKNQNFIKLMIASICFLICIALVPERPASLASICERYHSAAACEVW
tara:strand:- start:186 stop:410 length:225 start_codon:yes stop_codon:yes gene_type:complete